MDTSTRGAVDSRLITWLFQHGGEVERFIRFANDKGIQPSQLAIAWVSHSAVVTSPIVGVSSLSQLESATKAFEITLSEEDYQTITSISIPKSRKKDCNCSLA